MVKLLDLKKSINGVLKSSFPYIRIHAAESVEGFKKPVFFTQIIPIDSQDDTVNYQSHRVMVVINYFSEKGTELENLKMHDDIRKAFGMTLKVNHRSFLLHNVRSEIVDEVLQFRFDLNYLVGVEKEETEEVMEKLELRMKRSD